MTYDTAKRFAEKEIRPHIRDRANDETFPLDVMRTMAGAGLLAGPFPEEYAGASTRLLRIAVRGDRRRQPPSSPPPSPYSSPVSTAIHNFGSEEQRKRWLPDIFAARKIGAFALSEPNVGSDPAAGAPTAKRDGDDWVLNGAKIWISNGSVADLIVVFAQADPGSRHKGMAAFVVDGDSAGLEPGHPESSASTPPTPPPSLDGVRVPATASSARLGTASRSRRPPSSGRTTAACAVGIISPASTPASLTQATAAVGQAHRGPPAHPGDGRRHGDGL
jgi:alkylation response protein AidB-like acyl-CoA dehydrogenase